MCRVERQHEKTGSMVVKWWSLFLIQRVLGLNPTKSRLCGHLQMWDGCQELHQTGSMIPSLFQDQPPGHIKNLTIAGSQLWLK